MAKTLEERGYPIIDVHGHQGNLRILNDGSPGQLPPVKKQQIALEKYFRKTANRLRKIFQTQGIDGRRTIKHSSK
jgi:hypothetical protein